MTPSRSLFRAAFTGALISVVFASIPAAADVPIQARGNFVGAQALMKQSQYRAAVDLLDGALKEAPDFVDALRLRADAREKLAGPDATLEALAAPKAGVDYKQLASLLKVAADDLQRVIELDGNAKDMDAIIDRVGQMRARQSLAEKLPTTPPPAAPPPAPALAPPPAPALAPPPAPAIARAPAPAPAPPPSQWAPAYARAPTPPPTSALAAAAPAAPSSTSPFDKRLNPLRPGLAGFLVRPVVCVVNCNGTIFTFGPEIGFRYFAFAFRYGYQGGGHFLMPDLRFGIDIEVTNRVFLTPFLELTPLIATGGGLTIFQFIVRPGARLGLRISDEYAIYLEPVALDIATISTASGGRVASSFAVRYSFGFGFQARF